MPVSGPSGRTVCTEPLPKVWLPMMVARWWSCSAPATISLAEAEPSLTSTTSGTDLSAAAAALVVVGRGLEDGLAVGQLAVGGNHRDVLGQERGRNCHRRIQQAP